jgi:hypothetical protein
LRKKGSEGSKNSPNPLQAERRINNLQVLVNVNIGLSKGFFGNHLLKVL